jgi:hypothetical protein
MGIGLWAMNKKVLNGKGFDSSLGKEMMWVLSLVDIGFERKLMSIKGSKVWNKYEKH